MAAGPKVDASRPLQCLEMSERLRVCRARSDRRPLPPSPPNPKNFDNLMPRLHLKRISMFSARSAFQIEHQLL